MQGLMLHCGAGIVELDQVAEVETPEASKSHVPIPHVELIDRVRDSLGEVGFDVVGEAHGLADGTIYEYEEGQKKAKNKILVPGGRYFGLLEVTRSDRRREILNGAHLDSPDVTPDYDLVIGLRNSHDKSYPAALALGARVFVCDNLSFSGEVVIGRKHTVNIRRDLPELVHRAMAQLYVEKERQAARFEEYKAYEISDVMAHDLAVRALQAEVYKSNRINQVVQEWHNPSHDEFAQEANVWRFFNAVTEAVKPRGQEGISRLNTNFRGLRKLHTLLDKEVGFDFTAPEIVEGMEVALRN